MCGYLGCFILCFIVWEINMFYDGICEVELNRFLLWGIISCNVYILMRNRLV